MSQYYTNIYDMSPNKYLCKLKISHYLCDPQLKLKYCRVPIRTRGTEG